MAKCLTLGAVGLLLAASHNCTSETCTESPETSLLQHKKEEHSKATCEAKCGVTAVAYPYFNTELWGEQDKGPQTSLTCNYGGAQSPINICRNCVENVDSPWFATSWSAVTDVPNTNTGHNLQVDATIGTISVGPDLSDPAQVTTFDTYGWHIHAPSEHTIRQKRYDMELHITSKLSNTTGTPPFLYAVVAVFLKVGQQTNPCIAAMLNPETPDVGCRTCISSPLDLDECFKDQLAGPRWIYDGSLTTPPCSEFVKWIVLEQPATITRQDLTAFQSRYDLPSNARPVQELNGRTVNYYAPR